MKTHRPSHRCALWLPIHRGVSTLIICTLLVAILVLAASGGSTVSSPSIPATTRTPSSTPTQLLQPFVTYHGGRVQLSPSAYLIFWGPGWQTDPSLHLAMQALENYFAHVGGSSYESILTQYYMQNPDGSRSYINNVTHFSTRQVWLDPAVPHADDQSCGGPTIRDASVLHEIIHALSAAHWIKDSQNATYFIYTPPAFAIAEPGWGCSGKDYCADHEWSSALQVSYSVDPANCNRQGTPAEKLVWTSAHEQFESISDPTPGRSDDKLFKNEGWFHLDPRYGAEEIGDLCTRVQGYNVEQLEPILRRFASRQAVFQVKTSGLGIFNGPHPVLYIPVVRSTELTAFHQALWPEISTTGSGISNYYHPANWIPHITIGFGDINKENLSNIVRSLAERDFNWEVTIDNVALIHDTETKQELRSRFSFGNL